VDPHAVLGVAPGASPDEVTAAYRRLAKAHHPDRSGADTKQIRDINAAYAMLRDGLAAGAAVARPPAPRPNRPQAPGAWLAPAVRMALGAELLGALQPGEQVRHVAAAATWDAHDVRLVLTDRRLLWLRDDALTDRVRSLRLADLDGIESRRGRRGRAGELRVRVREGRRQDFAELRPESLAVLERALQAVRGNADTERP
jgi:hypothetical protein